MTSVTTKIDTANFAPNQLVDDIDRQQYERLTRELHGWDRDATYTTIINARFAIDGLTIRELMLKDAKVFHCSNGLTMFAATLHCPLDDLLNRPGAWDEISQFLASDESNKANLLLMMGTVASGENRGFGWYAPQLENFNENLLPFLESVELFKWSDYEKLPVTPVGGGARIIAGSDGKVVSRKKALPIFMPWFERQFNA